MAVEDPDWPRASGLLDGPVRGGRRTLALLGLPLAQASISPSAANETPRAVRAALRRFSTLAVPPQGPPVDLRELDLLDLGDLEEIADLPNVEAQEIIRGALAELQARPGIPARPDLLVLLGGDNAITRPALAGLADDLSTAGLLTLDAHHDVRGFHAGPTNGTPVRGLVEEGLPGGHVVQIGIGTFTNAPAHRQWCDEHGVTVVPVHEARSEGVGPCVARHLADLAARCAITYVDLDVDVLDAAYAPGCPGARPGGLTPSELHAAAYEAGRSPGVAAIDIVEVDAAADVGGVTVDNAALCLLHAAAGLLGRQGALASEGSAARGGER